MAGIKEIQKRRNVAQATKKITKTMGMIAASKFRRAMDRAEGATPYIDSITKLVTDLMAQTSFEHPLLEKRETVKKQVLILLTSNQGLCGAYNSNINKLARSELRKAASEGIETEFRISGKKGYSYFRNFEFDINQRYTEFSDTAAFEPIEAIAQEFIDRYSNHEIDRIQVVYTQFLSSSKQQCTVDTLLPFTLKSEDLTDAGNNKNKNNENSGEGVGVDFLYEPSPGAILEELLPQAVKAKFFKYFLDAVASEHVARMVAMKSATDNADKMIKQLTQLYNRARQSKITMEILEIMAGAEAIS